jgi:hypothetical protein
LLKSANDMVTFTANCTQESPSNICIKKVLHVSGKTQFGNLYGYKDRYFQLTATSMYEIFMFHSTSISWAP